MWMHASYFLDRSAITKVQAMVIAVVIIIAAVAAGAYYATLPKPAPPPTVKEVVIGVVQPMTGGMARHGLPIVKAIRMAAEEVNEAGGIKSLGGAKIKLVEGDCKSDPEVAKAEAERLITAYKPTAFLGPYSSVLTLAFTEVTERYKIPSINSGIALKITQRGYKYCFRNFGTATDFATAQAIVLGELSRLYGWSPDKIAIVYENTDYGTSTSAELEKLIKQYHPGISIVLKESYPRDVTDVSDLILKVKASGAKMLFPIGYLNDQMLIIRTIHELKVPVLVFGGGGGFLLKEFGKSLGAAVENVLSPSLWQYDMNIPGVPEFSKKFKERYPEEGWPEENTGTFYAAFYTIYEAIERAGSADPEKVRDALASIDIISTREKPNKACALPSYDEKSGVFRVKFDQTGQNIYAKVVVMQWQDGQMVTIWPDWAKQPTASLRKPM
jgi:branched-chain amino acid transport system substrate-binding protein